MRLSLLAALLSTVLMPVAANAQNHRNHDARDRSAHVARPDRPVRAERADRGERAVRPAITYRAPRVDPPARDGNRATRPIRRVDPDAFRADRTSPRATVAQRDARRERNVREDRRDRREDRAERRQERREDRAERRRDRREDRVERRHDRREDRAERRRDRHDGAERRWDRSMADWRDHYRGDYRFRDRLRWSRRHSTDRWDRDGRWDRAERRHDRFDRRWRNDHRYDWRNYRERHRSVFHLPRYYAPYGWDHGYRRFSIGLRLDSILFGSAYWITDPWYYRLPPAYGPYRWVRYYDDALLVDLRTGEVIDVVYDIFW